MQDKSQDAKVIKTHSKTYQYYYGEGPNMRERKKGIQSLKEDAPKLLQSTAKSAVSLPKLVLLTMLWHTLPKHRSIQKLYNKLKPLEDAPPEIQHAREQLFKRVAFKIKARTQRQAMPTLLDSCKEPAGPEQMFLAAIYPLALRRNLIVYTEPTEPHRLDVEIGYIGHADVFYYWILQLDGEGKATVDKVPEPQREEREDKLIHVYQIPAAGFVDTENWDADEFIVKVQLFFINILEDLKRRGYRIAPAKSHISDTVYWQRKRKENADEVRYLLNKQRRDKKGRSVRTD